LKGVAKLKRLRDDKNSDGKSWHRGKQLMFQVSANLSEPEAVSFAKTLKLDEKYYLVKVFENPKARHIAKRERYVIVRHLR